MRFTLPIAVLAVVAAGLCAFCDKSGRTFNLGGVGPATGEAANFGLSTQKGLSMAVEEWNERGGVLGRRIRLHFADDKGDPGEGATVYTKLIEQNKVSAIVGTTMSKVSLAGAPICQAAGIPMISHTSTNPKVTQVGDYIFRATFIDPFQGSIGATFAMEQLYARKAACLFDVGNDYTQGLAEFFKAKFTALGGQVTAFEGHPTGTPDFKAQLTKIIATRPDVLYLSDYYGDVALIAKQARELGFQGPMLGGDGWDSPQLTAVGGAALEGCFFTNHFAKDDPRPLVQDFTTRFKAKYQIEPDGNACLAYDAAYLMLDAVRRAGSSNGQAIRDALKASDLEVVSGHVQFDRERNPIKPVTVLQVKGGKFVYHATVQPS